MAVDIHPSAIVDPNAVLEDGVSIGAFSMVGPNVKIGARTVIGPHCMVDGYTTIGEDNTFYRYCSIGGMPQDKKYAGEATRLVIGDRNTVREFVTFNTGTVQDVGVTTLGSDNWVMAYVHVAHDCQIGNQTILANSVQMGGHVHIGDWAIIGGLAAIHQFCKVGAHAMVGGSSALHKDVPPFAMSSGNPCVPVGINVEGLKRRGFSTEEISSLREAYRIIYRRGLSIAEAREQLVEMRETQSECAQVLTTMIDFIDGSSRGIIRP